MSAQLSINFDVCANRSRRNSNSAAAHRKTAPGKRDKWLAIYRIIELLGPKTSKELAAELNVPLHHVSGRCSELKHAGLLYEAVTALGEPIRKDGAAVLAIARPWSDSV